jgi:hypothetical protein
MAFDDSEDWARASKDFWFRTYSEDAPSPRRATIVARGDQYLHAAEERAERGLAAMATAYAAIAQAHYYKATKLVSQ